MNAANARQTLRKNVLKKIFGRSSPRESLEQSPAKEIYSGKLLAFSESMLSNRAEDRQRRASTNRRIVVGRPRSVQPVITPISAVLIVLVVIAFFSLPPPLCLPVSSMPARAIYTHRRRCSLQGGEYRDTDRLVAALTGN